MPVNLQGSRPLNQAQEPLAVSLIAEPPIENDADNSILFRVSRQDLTPPSFILSVSTTDGETTITGANLSQVRVGDAIAHANITGTITAVNTAVTPHTATISAAATATGTVNATFTPPAFDAAVVDVVAKYTMFPNDSNLYLVLELHTYDGSQALDSDRDGKDNVLTSPTSKRQEFKFTLNMDQFLANVRIPRTSVNL